MKLSESQLRNFIRKQIKETVYTDGLDSEFTGDMSGENWQYTYFMNEVMKGNARIYSLSSDLTLVHRTKNLDLTYDKLDPLEIRKTKQSKRNSAPKVGIYAYNIEDDVPGFENNYGENEIIFVIPAGTKVLDLTSLARGTSARINIETAKQLISRGIDLVTGYDVLGPQEWAVLRKPGTSY